MTPWWYVPMHRNCWLCGQMHRNWCLLCRHMHRSWCWLWRQMRWSWCWLWLERAVIASSKRDWCMGAEKFFYFICYTLWNMNRVDRFKSCCHVRGIWGVFITDRSIHGLQQGVNCIDRMDKGGSLRNVLFKVCGKCLVWPILYTFPAVGWKSDQTLFLELICLPFQHIQWLNPVPDRLCYPLFLLRVVAKWSCDLFLHSNRLVQGTHMRRPKYQGM